MPIAEQLHLLFIQHGRACKDCTALGVTVPPAEAVAECPLKPFLGSRRAGDVQDEGGEGTGGRIEKEGKYEGRERGKKERTKGPKGKKEGEPASAEKVKEEGGQDALGRPAKKARRAPA